MEVLPKLNLLDRIECIMLWSKSLSERTKKEQVRLDELFKKGYRKHTNACGYSRPWESGKYQ